MKKPPTKKAQDSDDIEEFAEWVIAEAEERGLAMAAFIGLAVNDGEKEIDFEAWHTSLSLINIKKLEEKAISAYQDNVMDNIIEEIRSSINIYLKSPIATALDM